MSELSHEYNIGIWGASNAGKTTFLVRLSQIVKDSDKWDFRMDKEAHKFLHFHKKRLEERRVLEATDIPRNEEIKVFRYTLISRTNKTQVTLNFIDAPGRFYEGIIDNEVNVSIVNEQNQNEFKDIIDYLMNCHGIIFLLDPKRDPNQRRQYTFLNNLFDEMQLRSENKEKLEQYVAFCVTKADDKDIREKSKYLLPVGLVFDILGVDATLNWLSNYFWLDETKLGVEKPPSKQHRCQFYRTSSIGVYYDKNGISHSGIEQTDPPTITNPIANPAPDSKSSIFGGNTKPTNYFPNSNQNEIRFKQDVCLHPFGVIEPVEWLITGIIKNTPSLPQTQKSPSK